MSYQYSNGLCHEALRRLSANEKFEFRLARAFSEMGVARYGDTSDEIWKEWKELETKYISVSSSIYQQRKGGEAMEEGLRELENCRESLVGIICDWMEHNAGQISKGKLRRAS
jgi:hypothetical protein